MTPQVDVLLFVDMPDANAWQREQFCSEMQVRKWHVLPDREDTFRTAFRGQANDAEILRASEFDAWLAAEASGVSDWEGVCVLSG